MSEKIILSKRERAELQSICRSTTVPHGKGIRAKIILKLADNQWPKEISEALGVSRGTVYKWKERYLMEGIDGLNNKPKSGRPSTLDEKKIKQVLELSTDYLPEEATQWSVRLMAEHSDLNKNQVHRIWKAFDIKPHLSRTFKISNDPEFADKVVDIVGLYMNPPTNAMVLSVDEKTQIQALDRTQPGLPLSPGKIGSHTHDYKRHGTATLYAAYEIATGKVIGQISNRSRSKEFIQFLNKIDRQTPKSQQLHIVLDNHSAHKTKEVNHWLKEHPRFCLHFTPTSSSWINAVESWFSQLERRSLYRGVFSSVGDLKKELRRFVDLHNRKLAKPYKWTKPADKILKAVDRAKQSLRT
jgi:transposase